jgi:4-oxalocrotonate tautomerase
MAMPEKDKEKTMPHVLVKVWPGKTAQQKTRRAGATAKDVIEVLHDGEASVSVAFEEVTSLHHGLSVTTERTGK